MLMTSSTSSQGCYEEQMKQKINGTERSAWQSREMLVIIGVALDSFWQTSSLSYVLEFEKKSHSVIRK